MKTNSKLNSVTVRSAIVASLLLLNACQVQVATNPPVKPGDPKPKPSSPTVVKASPSASPSVAPSSAPLNLLQKPSGEGTVLQGQVQIDAHYLLSTGKGKLIGQAGGNLIGQAGGNVIAVGGGNLIGQAGGNLIGQAGGNLIGQAGGNLIATDAANLIGQAGGNLIGKRKYDLLQAGADSTLTIGQSLPAAEMLLQVVSMATGKPLALGKDRAGNDVYGIYTNATGNYTIYVPPTVGSNVLLVALPPNYLEDRLNYQVVQHLTSATSQQIDEDNALLSDYVREAFASRMERAFEQSSRTSEPVSLVEIPLPEAIKPLMAEKVNRLLTAGKTADDTNRRQRALRAADALLAFIDLEKVKVRESETYVMPLLRDMLSEMRRQTTLKMADKAYFPNLPYMLEANAAIEKENAEKGTQRPLYEIKKPSDLPDFVRRHVLASSAPGQTAALATVFKSVEMPDSYAEDLNKAMEGILTAVGMVLLSNEDAMKLAEIAARGE